MSRKSDLVNVSGRLGENIVELHKWLTNDKKEYVMSKQILRSATSVGANISEAFYAVSKAEFISKMQISLKEVNETIYWIRILKKNQLFDEQFKSITNDCYSIKRMLSKSLQTAKSEDGEDS